LLKKKEREKLIFEINITPLTDVMMVLLVIFMVTTPLVMQGSIKINLPSATAPSKDIAEKDIVIGITADGKVFLNGAGVADDAALLSGVKELLEKTGSKRVIIEGDKNARHGRIVKVMSVAREAGADKLAVSTIPETSKEEIPLQ
jgi:biopolymer transport protein ExbD